VGLLAELEGIISGAFGSDWLSRWMRRPSTRNLFGLQARWRRVMTAASCRSLPRTRNRAVVGVAFAFLFSCWATLLNCCSVWAGGFGCLSCFGGPPAGAMVQAGHLFALAGGPAAMSALAFSF